MSSIKTIYEDEDFEFLIEKYDENLYLHCHVFNYNKSVHKQAKAVFEETKKAAYFNGWDRFFALTPDPKFCRMFGAKTIESLVHEGKYYEVMVWELEQ